jgi:D-alanyl-lipoteichoic acid acyltransferase DltB (MBOAT superfamily)
MVVNSWAFLLFFVVVFIFYYLPIAKSSSKYQNACLLLSSYFFYGYVDLKMIALLLGSTIVFYLLGIGIKQKLAVERYKAAASLRTLGVVLGVGILFYFKYLNFFADSVAQLLNAMGLRATWTTLNIVMPLGVSFFTFKLISYVVEVCRERIEAETNFVNFANYVSFFPTILAGPIDSPKGFLPQLAKRRTIDADFATDGFRQILWGMLKKMVVADNLSIVVDNTWTNTSESSALVLVLCVLIYPIQMYMDFSGYSDMAIGVGKILNLKVAKNFNYPFFVTNVAEYWRRWHMSLTGWLTEYVFMPINVALRDWGVKGTAMAIMINFVLIGAWHGANWTFILFGAYYGLLYIPLIASGDFQKKQKIKFKGYIPNVGFLGKMLGTYLLVAIGLIIFRAPSVGEAWQYVADMFSAETLFSLSNVSNKFALIGGVLFTIGIMLLEWHAFLKGKIEYAIQCKTYTWLTYLSDFVILMILFSCSKILDDAEFIYMRF